MGLISNGTTIFDNGSMASGFGGNLNFISKSTASASASIEFTSGIDSTYKEYVFYFTDIHPSVDSAHFSFHGSTNGGTSYSLNHVSTAFRAIQQESGSSPSLQYHADDGGTAQFGLHNEDRFNIIASYVGSDNDQICAGYMHLFNPSSTTFVKHWTSHFSISNSNNFVARDRLDEVCII